MKIALCVFPIQHDIMNALRRMEEYVNQASENQCDLVVFPEAFLTGIDLSSNYVEDSQLGLSIDSKEITSIRQIAKDICISIAFGYLEIADRKIYDSALLINDNGEIQLNYRRQSGAWVDSNANSDLYCCGEKLEVAETKFGRTSFLICGDIFTPGIVENASIINPNFVIYIMARSFNNTSDIQHLWDTVEMPFYLEKWGMLDATILSVNLLEMMDLGNVDIYCGGAYIVDNQGKILASKPLLEAGLLIYEF
jgi:predicted amidohydrolase